MIGREKEHESDAASGRGKFLKEEEAIGNVKREARKIILS